MAMIVRAGKSFLRDNGPMLASALAYSSFFAIPSVLLVAVGLFTLVAGPSTIAQLMAHFSTVMPGQATSLLGGSLRNLDAHPASSIAMTVVGFVLAFWSTTGAMSAYMTAINITYEREDRRSFIQKRIVAVEMVAAVGFAFVLVAVLLIVGPQVEKPDLAQPTAEDRLTAAARAQRLGDAPQLSQLHPGEAGHLALQSGVGLAFVPHGDHRPAGGGDGPSEEDREPARAGDQPDWIHQRAIPRCEPSRKATKWSISAWPPYSAFTCAIASRSPILLRKRTL